MAALASAGGLPQDGPRGHLVRLAASVFVVAGDVLVRSTDTCWQGAGGELVVLCVHRDRRGTAPPRFWRFFPSGIPIIDPATVGVTLVVALIPQSDRNFSRLEQRLVRHR